MYLKIKNDKKNNLKRIHWAAEFIVSHQASSLVVTNKPQKSTILTTEKLVGQKNTESMYYLSKCSITLKQNTSKIQVFFKIQILASLGHGSWR